MKKMSGSDGTTRFPGVRLVVFDLDGTLVDSARDLIGAVNAMRAAFELPVLSDGTVMGFIGHGARELVRHALEEGGAETPLNDGEIDRGVLAFREYYTAHLLDHTRPYPGVVEALDGLRDRALAVLTNKPLRFTLPILHGLQLAGRFQRIYGEDSFSTKKPDPAGMRELLREFGAAPHEAIMVGDAETDVLTARNAGTWMCGVSYGLSSHRLVEYPPDLLVDSLTELLPALTLTSHNLEA
jgi:phosphoglycolate phosphatase